MILINLEKESELVITVNPWAGQSVALRGGGGVPQQLQLLQQASVPVQVPVSAPGGQTVYQTVHFPLHAFQQQPQHQILQSQMQILPQLTQVFITERV